MQILPIDLTAIIAVVMGISIVLIPVAGITARFALKPTVEALARLFEHKGLEETVDILERRMSLLEAQMESMDASLGRIADAVEFDSELRRSGRRSLTGGPDLPDPSGEPSPSTGASASTAAGETPGRGASGTDAASGTAGAPDRGGAESR